MIKQTISIFLWAVLALTSCTNLDNRGIATTGPTDIKDTTFLKSIEWDSLNKFVSFHILQNGNKTSDTNFRFTANAIAVCHYFNKQFELINDSTELSFKPGELKEFILSDSFSDRINFDCLLRINSQIGFHYRPDLLQTVMVRAKDMTDKNIKRIMTELKRENFTQNVKSEVVKLSILDTLLHDATKTVFIKIKLKPGFRGLKKINEVCIQLKKRPDVDQAFFADFFTGLNEGEIIYHLKTDEDSRR